MHFCNSLRLSYAFRKSNYKLILEEGTSYVDNFRLATAKANPVEHQIWERFFKHEDINFVKAGEDFEQRLLENENEVIYRSGMPTRLRLNSYPCQVFATTKGYFKATNGWAFQKDSEIAPVFNHFIAQMLQNGVVDKLVEGLLREKEIVKCTSDEFKPIKFDNIVTAFAILIVGIVMATSMALCEFLLRRRAQSQKLPAWEDTSTNIPACM